MIVSLVILSVIMTAAAASMISFAQQSSVNEHRLQATSYLTQLHEGLQAAPWDRVALYENELDELEALAATPEFAGRFDLDPDPGEPPTFDGDEIPLLPGPFDYGDCDEECSRLPFVPRTYREGPVSDDADARFQFEVFQIVTQRAIDGGDEANLKRFTTVVRWRMAGRDFQEEFDSERAASSADLRSTDVADVRLALFSPRPIEVMFDEGTGEWSNATGHDVVVRFREPMDLSGVTLYYPQADGGFGTIDLDHDVGFSLVADVRTAWSASIGAGQLSDLPAPLVGEPREIELLVVGESSALAQDVIAPIEAFVIDEPGWDGLVGGSVSTDGTTTVEVAVDGATGVEDVLCDPLTLDLRFEFPDLGLSGDALRDAIEERSRATVYFAGRNSQSRSMQIESIHPSEKRVDFQVVFAAGEPSPLVPPRNEPDEDVAREERLYIIGDLTAGDADAFVHESLIFASDVLEVTRRGFGYPCGGG